MPLTSTGRPGIPDEARKAIGFWMTVEGAAPTRPIWVLVTYEALWQIDTSKMRDVHAAIEVFNQNRPRIEIAASSKFDNDGVDDGEQEGQPILFVRSNDLV